MPVRYKVECTKETKRKDVAAIRYAERVPDKLPLLKDTFVTEQGCAKYSNLLLTTHYQDRYQFDRNSLYGVTTVTPDIRRLCQWFNRPKCYHQ